MAYNLIGQNFTPHDVVAKVTGRAKYAEDFRADGMVFCKLLTSPMPHARIRSIDTSDALKIPGVLGILTADDVPQFPPPQPPILAKDEVFFVGDPILAVAAEMEEIAADAIEAIKIDFEQLPHVVDPLDSLFPGGPNARSNGNVAAAQINLQTVKWDAGDFAARRRQDADGQAGGEVELRRSRRRLQGVEAGDRGKLRHRRLFASQHGDRAPPSPIGRAASASCTARTRATPRRCRTSPAISASSRRTWCSSPSIAAAASAARSPAIRSWRSPRCCRRSSTGR